jgi:hypothetical protein
VVCREHVDHLYVSIGRCSYIKRPHEWDSIIFGRDAVTQFVIGHDYAIKLRVQTLSVLTGLLNLKLREYCIAKDRECRRGTTLG